MTELDKRRLIIIIMLISLSIIFGISIYLTLNIPNIQTNNTKPIQPHMTPFGDG